MSENIIIAGKWKNTYEMGAHYLAERENKKTVVFCKDPLVWIGGKCEAFVDMDEVHIINGAFCFPEMIRKAGMAQEDLTEILRVYMARDKKCALNHMEELILTLIVKRALKKADFFQEMSQIPTEQFRAFYRNIRNDFPDEAEMIEKEKKEAVCAYNSIQSRLPRMGFLPWAFNLGMWNNGILLVTTEYAPLCTLFIECLYRIECDGMDVHVWDEVWMRKEILEIGKTNGISTFITTPSVDFLGMHYKGMFRDFIRSYDRIVLCGEQIMRQKTAHFLARLTVPPEDECREAEQILVMEDGQIRSIGINRMKLRQT